MGTPGVVGNPARSRVLCIRSLNKGFAHGPANAPRHSSALVDVNMDLQSGEVLGIVGAAGSGKTTLLQCAAGVLRRDRGIIEWFGAPFAGGSRVAYLAYVPPMPVYYPFLTVRDVLEYHIARDDLPQSCRDDSIASALSRLELDNISAAYVCDLPRESVKRLAVAEALTARAQVIFLDTAASDMATPFAPVVLRALAHEAASGRAVVVAVRDARLVAPIASRIMLLEQGRNAGTFSSDERRSPAFEGEAHFTSIGRPDRLVAERLH